MYILFDIDNCVLFYYCTIIFLYKKKRYISNGLFLICVLQNSEQSNTAMPAMPKEKSSILAETNYADLKMKDNMMASVRKELSPNDTASPTTVTVNKTDSNKCAMADNQHHHNLARSNSNSHSKTQTPPSSHQNTNVNINPLSTTKAASTIITPPPHQNSSHHKMTSTTTTTASTTTTTSTPKAPISDPTKSRTPHDYRFGKSIGEGSFSTVYLAKDIHTLKEYASKLI